MGPQAKAQGREGEHSPLRCPCLDLGPLASGEYISVVLSTPPLPVCGHWEWQPQDPDPAPAPAPGGHLERDQHLGATGTCV